MTIGISYPQEGLAVDSGFVYYWFSSSGYRVNRVVKDGSDDADPLAIINAVPYFQNIFGVDAMHVYGVGYYGELIRVTKTP